MIAMEHFYKKRNLKSTRCFVQYGYRTAVRRTEQVQMIFETKSVLVQTVVTSVRTLGFLNDSFDQMTKLQAILIMLKTLIFYGIRNRLSCLGTPDNEEGLSKRIQTRRPVSNCGP